MPYLLEILQIYYSCTLHVLFSILQTISELVVIPNTLQCGGFERSLHEAVLWMGRGPLQSVLHYDDLDNLLCVFEGEKDVVLIDKVKYLYLFTCIPLQTS